MADNDHVPTISASDCVIGVDGGGSTTRAWLANAAFTPGDIPLGTGEAGPCNPQSVGWETALTNLDQAVDEAFAAAVTSPCTVAAACVALAGGDRDEARHRLSEWAQARQLASRFFLTHDVAPLLAAGTPQGCGIAIVSGTGALAYGRSASGAVARSGGWGFLFGDEGSGFAVAVAGLRAVAQAADGRAAPTALTDRFLQALAIDAPAELVQAVYSRNGDRSWIASLAPIVIGAANEGDGAARLIIAAAAQDLAAQVAAAARTLGMDNAKFPLAIGGGLLIHSSALRDEMIARLNKRGLRPCPIEVVAHPVSGAVLLACRAAADQR